MKYWPFTDPLYPIRTSTGGPTDQNASFSTDVGPPITRRRTTGRVEAWRLAVLFQDRDKFADFDDWYQDDLQAGALPFVWRHPGTKRIERFQFSPARYDASYPTDEWVRVTFTALILPGRLWFADYVPEATAWVPLWVADYAAGKFWIGQEQVAATALGGLTGTYIVHQSAGAIKTLDTRSYTGNIPQTAPSGVSWLAGFANAA